MEIFNDNLIKKTYKRLYRIRTFFQNRIIFLIQEIFFLFLRNEDNSDKNNVLIVRLDSIGDYILFRNYLIELRKAKEFESASLTLCGNLKWKQLGIELDGDTINKFIWIDIKKFYNNVFYRFRKLKLIN